MKKYSLEKPKIKEPEPKKMMEILQNRPLLRKAFFPVYLYWDKIKYKSMPKGITPEEYWASIKIFRKVESNKTVIKTEGGEYFRWMKLDHYEVFFHEIDLNTGGNLTAFKRDVNEDDKNRFILRGIMEEAIASSQLEGASTTRQVAKQFLREGRRPKDKSEQMILNNYRSMQAIEETYKQQELSPKMLFEMHAMVTENVLEKDRVGVFRKDEDDIVVTDSTDSIIYHKAPKIKFVKKEIDALIEFANNQETSINFIHPVVKAIMLHFWMGYLHPFNDGNGRLARLIFYWYLLRNGYWAFAYLPISKIIKKSPGQYSKAYIYSEQDDSDLTYFIDYNIRKIQLAVKEFNNYVDKKMSENARMSKAAHQKYDLNNRQIELLQYFVGDREGKTNILVYHNIYGVSRLTAAKDLKKLEEKGFLETKKQGREVYYYPTAKISELIKYG